MTQAIDLANAINNFVVGCKQDGIWDPIKTCCIMAAWDGLNGALYPLKGAAPTNYNFVAGDYDRETGLKGNGSTKYLDSNRANNADPQNSQHLATNGTSDASTHPMFFIGAGGGNSGRSNLFRSTTDSVASSRNAINSGILPGSGFGDSFMAVSRASSSGYSVRMNGNDYTITQASQSPTSDNIFVFCRNNGSGTPEFFTDNRLAFYSIGESLDLEKLDTRVTRLIQQTAFSINTGLDGSIYDIDTLRYVNAGYAAGGTLT